VLRAEGLVDADGQVNPKLAERLRVLAAPDVEVAMLVSRGPINWTPVAKLDEPATWRAVPAEQLRVVLARRDGRWVSAARAGDEITIDDIAGGGEQWLRAILLDLLDALHPSAPSTMAAMNVPMEDMMAVAAGRAASEPGAPGHDAPLRALGVRGAALAELAAVLDEPLVEAVLYPRAHVDTETRHSGSALDVRDTDAGRVVLYRMAPVRGSSQEWMTIAPATASQVDQGVRTVMAGVDVTSWDSHQRM
jgi:hypothetical protein